MIFRVKRKECRTGVNPFVVLMMFTLILHIMKNVNKLLIKGQRIIVVQQYYKNLSEICKILRVLQYLRHPREKQGFT